MRTFSSFYFSCILLILPYSFFKKDMGVYAFGDGDSGQLGLTNGITHTASPM